MLRLDDDFFAMSHMPHNMENKVGHIKVRIHMDVPPCPTCPTIKMIAPR